MYILKKKAPIGTSISCLNHRIAIFTILSGPTHTPQPTTPTSYWCKVHPPLEAVGVPCAPGCHGPAVSIFYPRFGNLSLRPSIFHSTQKILLSFESLLLTKIKSKIVPLHRPVGIYKLPDAFFSLKTQHAQLEPQKMEKASRKTRKYY